ncbi:MAG: hypothetical protein K2X68_08615, partial [Novosphingobium sp.]|nr:hypothetical protein [Novosphingobium sp.]
DGYAIVGTTQFFGYTCYADGNRQQMVNLLGLALGQVRKSSTYGPVNPNTFRGTNPATFGIFSQANIGIVPAAWQTAIVQTFLTNSLQGTAPATLGSRNLWIQDVVELARSTRLAPTPTSNPNPNCPANGGA